MKLCRSSTTSLWQQLAKSGEAVRTLEPAMTRLPITHLTAGQGKIRTAG